MQIRTRLLPVFMIASVAFASIARAADAPATQPSSDAAARAQATIDKALAYLKSQQKPDHSWQGESDQPAVTAIVIKAFLGQKQYDAEAPFLNSAVEKLLSYQKPDGGIYKDMLANYNTAIAVSALAAANEAEYKPQVDKAVAFLKKLQWNEESGDVAERKAV